VELDFVRSCLECLVLTFYGYKHMAYMRNKEFEKICLHSHNFDAMWREEWSGAVVSRCSDLQNVHHRCCVLWGVAHKKFSREVMYL
jgi:hypothetical protein